jgi:hypothetical protein
MGMLYSPIGRVRLMQHLFWWRIFASHLVFFFQKKGSVKYSFFKGFSLEKC